MNQVNGIINFYHLKNIYKVLRQIYPTKVHHITSYITIINRFVRFRCTKTTLELNCIELGQAAQY